MLSYVNHQAIRDAFRPIEAEHDPMVRASLAKALLNEVYRDLSFQYSRTAFELKKYKKWNVGQIAEYLGVSGRHVKRMIRDYCETSGEWSPIRRRTEPYEFSDISALVEVQKEADLGGS